MSELGSNASVPWEAPLPTSSNPQSQDWSLQGRSYFSQLGFTRRKPSRPDAPPTLSKSCTDKLTVKQITSLLSFPTYHFIAPTPNAYLSSLILAAEKYSEVGCSRAFSPTGRLAPLGDVEMPEGYPPRPFKVVPLPEEFPGFEFGKPKADPAPGGSGRKAKASNLSALYIRHNNPSRVGAVNETLLNGVKQGYASTSADVRKASVVSRALLWKLGREIGSLLLERRRDMPGERGKEPRGLVEASTYADAKRVGRVGLQRQKAKEIATSVLPGSWPKNTGDDEWEIWPSE
jgi:tRNA-specific adenosine deaminase 1